MNIRFSNAFDSAAVQKMPAAIRNSDARLRLILSLIAVGALVVLVWLASTLWHSLFAPAAGRKADTAPPVKIAAVTQNDVTVTEHTLGTVVANATVQITARVTGQMMSASFKEGDIVHTGDVLFQIDPRPYQASLAQARAQMAKDQASLVSAQNDETRYTALAAQGAATKQQVDQAVAAAKGFAATVQSDRAVIEMAALNVGYTTIRSPIDGKTGPILIQPGNMVTTSGGSNSSPTASAPSTTSIGGTTTSGGTSANPLVVITQIQPVKVSFSLAQADLPRIQDRVRAGGLTASIDRHDASGKLIQAPVDFIGNAVSNTTGTIELRATYINADASLVPGQLVDVTVALNTLPHALIVPHQAVNLGPDGRYVYALDKNANAELVPVTVLFDSGATTAVSGKLKPGEKIITDGQIRVIPGKPVSVVKAHTGAGGK
jgi:multidrug efflux system membrane fusion protein